MKRIVLLILTGLAIGQLETRAQGMGDILRAPDKAVPVVNQTLDGTWLYELRRGGQPATQPPVLLLIQFNPDGSIAASAGDGTQSSHFGMWLRVGDRKFLVTTFLFGFNESRTLATITKIRANVLLSADGSTVKGTQEVVVLDPTGKVIATIPGGTFTGSRLTPEIPGDFYDFQQIR
ncbi:MAG TPA: hypothetical protein VKE70_07495 [Candidatus Solibacter sp.]|nr:hypothetical protein [Candidatus Solibacter sp.]